MVCTNCGYLGHGKRSMKGSFAMEVLLWLLFLLPGFIYSIWRLTTRANNVCPKCSHPNMIPADTPIGQELIAKNETRGVGVQAALDSGGTSFLSKVGIGLVLFVVLILVLGAMGF